jgi:D-ribulokinase
MVIGLDLGTSGVRALAVDAAGNPTYEARRTLRRVRRGEGGLHEQAPLEWLELAASCLEEVCRAIPTGASVAAIACTGTSGTVVARDDDHDTWHPALMYDDARSAAEASRCARLDPELAQPSFGLPKLAWLRHHLPRGERLRFLHPVDVLYEWLAGKPMPTDLTTARKSGSALQVPPGCLHGTHQVWPAALLLELGIAPAQLPAVVPPGAVIGRMEPALQQRLGLRGEVVLVAGATDANTAYYASGACRPGDWHVALGSTLALRARLGVPPAEVGGGFYKHAHPDGGLLLAGACNAGAGAWRHGDDEALDPRRVPPVAWYPLAGRGERLPVESSRLSAFAFSTSRAATSVVHPYAPTDLHGAACFGLALVERWCLQRAVALGAPTPRRVCATGGTVSHPNWMQLRAHVLQLPIEVPCRADSAFGAALLALSGAQGEPLARVVERCVRMGARYEPDPSLAGAAAEALSCLQGAVSELL